MEEFKVGETVRVNTPGESHHKRTGVILRPKHNRFEVDLGDVVWLYYPEELEKETK